MATPGTLLRVLTESFRRAAGITSITCFRTSCGGRDRIVLETDEPEEMSRLIQFLGKVLAPSQNKADQQVEEREPATPMCNAAQEKDAQS